MSHNKEEIIKDYIEAYNSFDVERMLKNLHRDIEFINISNGDIDLTLNGITAFKSQAEKATAYFESREQQILSIFYGDNHVEVDLSYTAVLATDFPNGLKAGEQMVQKGKSVFQFHDGLIVKLVDMS